MSNSYTPFHDLLDDEHLLNIYGYKVYRHGDIASFLDLKKKFTSYLQGQIKKFSGEELGNNELQIETYHNYVKGIGVDHDVFIKEYGRDINIGLQDHPFVRRMIEIAEEDTGKRLRVFRNKFEFRVVRPHSEDNNPLHRDHWFPYFTPLLNIYLPLSGSFFDSSLAVVPFSHKWSDEDVIPSLTYDDILEGTKTVKKNGVATSVPEIKETRRSVVKHRPDVLEGDFMLFSPLAVHGGGDNGGHLTRFSLEIRLEIC